MQTVFPNMQQVANRWVEQTQESGRSGNVFFEGRTIYSYGRHFPIATFVDPKKTAFPIVLFNSNRYSNSTAKHKSKVSAAIYKHAEPRRISVPMQSDTPNHRVVQLYFIREIQQALDKAKRARKYVTHHLGYAKHLRFDYNAYSEAFKLNWVKLVSIDDNVLKSAA